MTKAGADSYCYDADGNVIRTSAGDRTILYTPYDLPSTLVSGTNGTKVGFEYGPNREKLRRLNESGKLSTTGYAARALTAGAAGGVLASIQGQRFGSGFVSAGLSSALNPAVEGVTHNPYGQGFIAAIVGGTASEASGGKFANGAITGAFAFAIGKAIDKAAEEHRMADKAYGDPKYWVAERGMLDTLTAPWGGWNNFKDAVGCLWQCDLPGNGSLEANLTALPPIIGIPMGAANGAVTEIADMTAAGSRYANVAAKIAPETFQSNLISNGYSVIRETIGSNGAVTILSNGSNTYTIYTATSTGAASAQVTNAAGEIISKIRFIGP